MRKVVGRDRRIEMCEIESELIYRKEYRIKEREKKKEKEKVKRKKKRMNEETK